MIIDWENTFVSGWNSFQFVEAAFGFDEMLAYTITPKVLRNVPMLDKIDSNEKQLLQE